MATHGPCETEGPGLLPLPGPPSGIENITAGDQAPQRRPPTQTSTDYTKAGAAGPPGDNGWSRTGARTCTPHFISSKQLMLARTSSIPSLDSAPSCGAEGRF